MNCALAMVAIVNHYYGGDLSQDRIGYEQFKTRRPGDAEEDLNWGYGFDVEQTNDAFASAHPQLCVFVRDDLGRVRGFGARLAGKVARDDRSAGLGRVAPSWTRTAGSSASACSAGPAAGAPSVGTSTAARSGTTWPGVPDSDAASPSRPYLSIMARKSRA